MIAKLTKEERRAHRQAVAARYAEMCRQPAKRHDADSRRHLLRARSSLRRSYEEALRAGEHPAVGPLENIRQLVRST